MFRSTVLPALILGLVAGGILLPLAARARLAPPAAEKAFEAGLVAADDGKHEYAADSYDKAFRLLTPGEQATGLGHDWIDFASKEYAAVTRAKQDSRAKERSLMLHKALLETYLAAVAGSERPDVANTESAAETLREVNADLEMVQKLIRKDGTVAPPPGPTFMNARKLGISLIGVGGGLLGIGLGLTVAGELRDDWTDRVAKEKVYVDPQLSKFEADQELNKKIFIGVGIPSMLIGAGLVTWGTVVLVYGRGGVTLAPGPGGRGVSLVGRF